MSMPLNTLIFRRHEFDGSNAGRSVRRTDGVNEANTEMSGLLAHRNS